MSIGSWDPDAAAKSQSQQLDQPSLQCLRDCASRLANNPEQAVNSLLDTDQQQQLAPLMQLPASDWQQSCAELDSEELLQLIRFFTLAESLPGWQCGDKSPVIALAKLLKQRGQRLEREQLLWIREHSDNRFLPYGPL